MLAVVAHHVYSQFPSISMQHLLQLGPCVCCTDEQWRYAAVDRTQSNLQVLKEQELFHAADAKAVDMVNQLHYHFHCTCLPFNILYFRSIFTSLLLVCNRIFALDVV